MSIKKKKPEWETQTKRLISGYQWDEGKFEVKDRGMGLRYTNCYG